MKLFKFIGILLIGLMTFTASASEEGLTSSFDHEDQVVISDSTSYDITIPSIDSIYHSTIALNKTSLKYKRYKQSYILKYRAANPNFRRYITYTGHRDTYLTDHNMLC